MPVMVSPVPPMGSKASRSGSRHRSQDALPGRHIINFSLDQEIFGSIVKGVGPVNQIRRPDCLHAG